MNYLLIIVLLLLSAIFSGLEIAFITTDKLRLEIDKKQDKWYANILNPIYANPKKFIATLLIANNLVLVIYGIFSSDILNYQLSSFTQNTILILIITSFISTIFILFFGEFIPKSIFMLRANSLLYVFSLPSVILFYLFYPITWFFISLSDIFIRLIYGKTKNASSELVFSKYDLYQMVHNSMTNEEKQEDLDYELKIFHNALTFDKVKLKECIVPRTEIAAIEMNAPIQQIKDKFIETGYSKLLVYKDNMDNIVGYVHIGDIFSNPTELKQIIREIIIVPETLTANKLLSEFIQKKKSIALVVDEFGGTSGIVTIEDVLEEIFGEINDEHDTEDFIDKKIKENEYILSGRLEIDSLNQKYNLNIPESDEYETLAGFILFHHNSIPKPNETIKIDPFTIKIIKVTNTKIELVMLKVNQ
ncbi:MAG TPA: hemolysin family protein [Bacteroidales bacterium]|nr:hemolysin family protein [Bacteroidales bacterium]